MADTCSDDDILQELENTSERLEESEALRGLALDPTSPPKIQVIHKIECQSSSNEWGLYIDRPWVVASGPRQAHLRSSKAINNLDLYLERNKDISCIVYRVYSCCERLPGASHNSYSHVGHEEDESADDLALPVSERLHIVSDKLKVAWDKLICNDPFSAKDKDYEDSEDSEECGNPYTHHPYLWWFHHRLEIETWSLGLEQDFKTHIDAFLTYLDENLGDEWAEVDRLMSRGKITEQYLDYLFVPEQIVISGSSGHSPNQIEAYSTGAWPEDEGIEATHWKFDGNFERVTTNLDISKPDFATGEFPITAMDTYPVEYAPQDIVTSLRERGKVFWKCRHRNYVQYSASRYMVDTVTYNQMHPQSQASPYSDDLGPALMAQDDPGEELGDEFYMCLPTRLNGFDIQKKEWVKIDVADIREVVWNEEAFDLLVMEPMTKELVQAVVTNHVDEVKNTDLIHGKGNGLFILLHGVAEVTKKPLYRVTCGDIGTKAEDVERYLETVCLLGKTWGCVVLLDEADVFLEQRTLDNLDRNALVSVFLRVLEYYDGILILTSNRVGIFDEAFKSRIQLSLRYENLGESQRRQVWKNFINRLEKSELERKAISLGPQAPPRYGVDIESIRQQLITLAKPPLNGREIRNTISTARQLATFRKEMLAYKHLEACIEESNKFDRYIKTLKRGFSADEIKNDQQER
ncbi:hypothetical protein FLONG3_796 [Fusarium longipes]|uniref:Uncharacterized protein n=1 Tax=Fusarium longipes TaxID=694270 RepID=A0A395T930_9HYPO|nr:hypothetical protein FLONG3_796 [Fusarium longipes]